MTFSCYKCGGTGDNEVFHSINVRVRPELKDRVRDGSLFLWDCPHCGRKNLALYQTLYHDPDGKMMIWLLPESTIRENEKSGIEAQLSSIIAQTESGLEDYTLRRVSDIGSLIEKVLVHDAGLDDCVIELCKYVTKMELAEKASKEMAEASFKFYRMQGADNEMVFTFPQDGEMKAVNVGFNVYEDCRGILDRNPSVLPKSGFAKIDNDWVSSFLR